MTGPQAFTKRPVQIDAWQWDGTAAGATPIIDWINGEDTECCARWGCDRIPCTRADDGHSLYIDTLEGTMAASPGDWIIRGVQGEFYPCKPDIFQATYTDAGDPITASTARIAEEIADGRHRAHAKHGDTSIEGSGNHFEFLAILTEEVGEAAEALNDHRHDPAYPLAVNLRAELVDVATVAVAWAASIDARVGAAEC